MKKLNSPLFKKFENDEMKNLSRVTGGKIVATTDMCGGKDSANTASANKNGDIPQSDKC